MPRLTEEELINEVRHLHSLRRQGPPLPNTNPPIIINPRFTPNRPIFNPNSHSIYPVHHVKNPNNFNNRRGFDPIPGSFYPDYEPSVPILNHDHRPNAHTGYDSNGSGYSGVSNIVQPMERVRHGNLNNKLTRLSLGVQGTNMKKKGKKGGGGGYEEVKKWREISGNELNLKHAEKRVLTKEENARLVARKAQQKALEATREMFKEMMDSDGEIEDYSSSDDDDDDGGEGGMDDDMDDKNECKDYEFFLRVFAEDSELRSYYEKNCERGEFSCLVCAGLGQKVGKKYKDCVALVQHSTTIAKTKTRRAHRALGQVICKVLGWDIQKLP